jgi:predicted NBD/HSP70 family sugar kinase
VRIVKHYLPDRYARRVSGPGDVLELIRHGSATTRGDLIDRTGLSRMTVAQRVDALLAAGLIVEGSAAGAATGGRRRRTLAFNVGHAKVLAAALDTAHARVALTDLEGRIHAEARLEVSLDDGPPRVLDAICACAREVLDHASTGLDELCGMGISIPGPVDPATGRPSQPPIMPGWDAYPVQEHLAAGFPSVPVLAANDADAAAVGEWSAGFVESTSLCFVTVSTGIGSGIVIDGRSYGGVDGGAGDIGHVRLSGEDDKPCHCGGQGCLAAVASGDSVARQLTALGIAAASASEVGRLLATGQPDAVRLTQEAGRRIGEVLSTVVSVLNPGVVVLGGDLASPPLLSGVRESLYRLSLPRATRHLSLHQGALAGDAPLVGLTRLVVDQQFAAAAVNARLA